VKHILPSPLMGLLDTSRLGLLHDIARIQWIASHEEMLYPDEPHVIDHFMDGSELYHNVLRSCYASAREIQQILTRQAEEGVGPFSRE